MSRSYSGLVVGGVILAIVVIIGVVYYFAPFILRNRIPILVAGVILVVISLIVSGKIGAWRKKYREMQVNRRKIRIKNGIDGITKQIHVHLNHVNSDEAVRMTSESYRYLDEGDFKRAIESIKKAKELVDTNLDSISAEAKDLEIRADAQFRAKKYTGAQKLWNQSLAIYDEAEKFARHANDTDQIEAITKKKETIRGRIKESNTALDRQQLVISVDAGDRMAASADKHSSTRKFDDAKSDYERAKDLFNQALVFAGEKGLTGDQPEIKKKIAR
ncbi:MAG: hypothetical protein NTZ39_06520, partial [Methanoregula sp.]|nr:hypothetical protein [Methanoregula sp.]